MNGDGHADLLLCGWIDSEGAASAGKATVLSGADLSVLQTITSTTAGETLGFNAHGIGDVNGDGRPDYVVTAAQNAEAGALAGKVYLLAGGPPVAGAGAGSPGSGGSTPTLASPDCPRLGLTVHAAIDAGLGGASGVLFVGTQPGSFRLGGGELHLTPDFFVPHTLSGAPDVAGVGSASLELAVPWEPTLLGTTFLLQAAYLDAGAPLGISLSSALTLDITQP